MLECVAQFLRKTSKSLGPLCLATGIPMLVQMISAHPIRPALCSSMFGALLFNFWLLSSNFLSLFWRVWFHTLLLQACTDAFV